MPMGQPGKPVLDLLGRVRAVVVQYQVDIKILGNILLDQLEKGQEFLEPMPVVTFPQTRL